MESPFAKLPPQAQAWVAGLPDDAKPIVLASYFPRVVTMLAVCWKDRNSVVALLAQLLDSRNGRAGGAERELVRLLSLAAPASAALAETD